VRVYTCIYVYVERESLAFIQEGDRAEKHNIHFSETQSFNLHILSFFFIFFSF